MKKMNKLKKNAYNRFKRSEKDFPQIFFKPSLSLKKGMVKMKVIDKIALVLIIIGAINWGLVGFFQYNLVDTIFGSMSALTRIIYALVGISGLWGIKLLFDD